jgi:hypothetical protein
MTVPMHTLPPAERCHHRWPPWTRLGLVMKPSAGSSTCVTPRQPAAVVVVAVVAPAAAIVVAAVAAVVAPVAVLDRPAVS